MCIYPDWGPSCTRPPPPWVPDRHTNMYVYPDWAPAWPPNGPRVHPDRQSRMYVNLHWGPACPPPGPRIDIQICMSIRTGGLSGSGQHRLYRQANMHAVWEESGRYGRVAGPQTKRKPFPPREPQTVSLRRSTSHFPQTKRKPFPSGEAQAVSLSPNKTRP